jgi:hypothetical protein
MSKKSKEPHKEQTIRIALPERNWVVLLAILDQYIGKSVKPELERLRKKGTKFEDLDDIQGATLGGPIMIRGIIVKELTARGVMKPGANERIGIDKIMADAENFKKRLAAGEFDEKDSTAGDG